MNNRQRTHINLRSFCQVNIDAPEYRQIMRFISLPEKTIYINVAADADADAAIIIPYDFAR